MQIAVLGMHRSGTSVLTRLLGFMGCHLGDEDEFNPVRPDNPAGDWERTDVWALNEDVLSSLGATWCRVARFDLGRLDETTRTGFEGRAREIVTRLESRRPWAIKDPRLCLTLPVWRPALDAAVGVIPHREPLAVARSLQRRDEFPFAVGIALWEMYVLGSLRHSRGLPRIGVVHRHLMNDPAAALRGLRRELEAAGVDGLHDADEAQVRGFVDPSLMHGPVDPAEQATFLNPSQRRLATALEDGSALVWDDVPPLSQGSRDLLDGYFRLRDGRDRLRQDMAGMTADFEEQERKSATLARQVEDLERHRTELERRGAELERHGTELERHGAELERHGAELSRENAALTEMLEAQRNGFETDLDEIIDRGTQLEKLIELILSSRRWRYGNRAGELLGKVLRRSAQPKAEEHALRIVSSFRSLCREISNRRAESAED